MSYIGERAVRPNVMVLHAAAVILPRAENILAIDVPNLTIFTAESGRLEHGQYRNFTHGRDINTDECCKVGITARWPTT